MTRISSLIVASTLAILPVSAFAQQAAAPAKIAGPNSLTTVMPVSDKTVSDKTVTGAPVTAAPVTAAPVTGAPVTGATAVDKVTTAPASTAPTTLPGKSDAKTTGHGAKSDQHGMNGVSTPHVKTGAPAKTTEPAKS